MAKKINCIAIDDEPLSLQQITGYINRIDFLNLVKTFDNGLEALNYLHTHEVDLVFLDIMMDELSGIDLIESLDPRPYFIFTTGFDHYAVKAFELHATDYIQKPISFIRFMKAVDKVFKDFFKNPPAAANSTYQQLKPESKKSEQEFIFIKTKYKMQKLAFNDIYYIKGLNNYLIIKTPNDSLYARQSLNHIVKVLPTENFIRVHKSFIVAIDKIDVIGKNQLFINGENVPIGESYKEYFFNYLSQKQLMFFNNSRQNLYNLNN